MDYWDGKIAGLLHDPLDKVFRANHEVFAENVASMVLAGSKVDVNGIVKAIKTHHLGGYLRFPDMAASASNRTLIPSVNPSRVLLQNPFSGVLFDLGLLPPFSLSSNVQSVTSLAAGATGKEAALRVLSRLINVYMNIWKGGVKSVEKSLLLIPEDTRIPSSPMISHLQMTSALTDVAETLGFYMVYIDIGGVQEFISVSRRTVDFWASSYLVSLVSLSALLPLVRKFGLQQVIIPWCLRSPLVETCLSGEKISLDDVLSSTIPNSALVLLKGTPDGDLNEEEIRKMIHDGMTEFWSGVCDVFLEKLRNDYGVSEEVERQIRRQMEFSSIFTRIRVAVLNTRDLLEGKGEVCVRDVYKRAREEGGFDRLAELKNKLAELGLGYESYPLEDFEAIMKTLTVVMGSRKQYEAFSAETVPRGRVKCSLCGVRDHLGFSDEAWSKMEEKVVDRGERLCAICLLKRVFRDILPKVIEKLGGKMDASGSRFKVPSVSDVATTWFRASVLSLILAAVELNRLDEVQEAAKKILEYLDKAGELAGEKWETSERVFPNKLIEQLYDKILKKLSKVAENRDLQAKVGVLSKLADAMCFASSSILLLEELTARAIRSGMPRQMLEGVEESHNDAIRALRKLYERKPDLLEAASKKLFEQVCSLLKLSGSGQQVSSKIAEVILSPIQRNCEILAKKAAKQEQPPLMGIEKKKEVKKLPVPVSFLPQNRFALLRMDGDDVGKWISGELLPPWQILIAPTNEDQTTEHRKMLKRKAGDDFGDVYSRHRTISPSTLSVLSMVISSNVPVVKSVVEAFGGFLVYTGGDDVLAFLPPEVWHYVYLLLRFLYSREIMDCFKLDNDWLYVYGMGARATASFSVIVAHHKAHLKQVIRRSQELLDRLAKELVRKGAEGGVKVKDGLSVVLMSRSAPTVTARAIPNMLVRSGGRNLSIRELDERAKREAKGKITAMDSGVVELWKDTFTPIIKAVYGQDARTSAYRDVYGKASDLYFAGVAPDPGGIIDWETVSAPGGVTDGVVYTPLSDAIALCDLVASGTVSSEAFYKIHELYEEITSGKIGQEDLNARLTVLRAEIKHKLRKKDEEGYPVAEVLLKSVEKFMSEEFLIGEGGEALSLLEVVPLSLVLSRCLENTVLSLGGW
ncbi:MAG: type III-B CRISPR-associated protein Cas10/Cmr2 [Candidatus Jordarchaeales archaeon]